MKRLLLLLLSCLAVYAQQNAMMLPWIPQQFTDTSGRLLTSGKVCTYQAGTSTGLATYTDSTATVSNSVPPNAVLLDSTARPTSGGIWLKPNLAYKIVTMTAGSDGTCNTGVIIKTQDNVLISNPSAGLYFDVRNNGAKCDGVTDDTTAIQAALTAANAALSGGTVLFPRNRTGPCVIASTLNLNLFANVTLEDGLVNPSSGNNVTSVATLKFTGTCSGTACVQMQSTLDITFIGIKLWFSGATAGPMIDLKRNGANPSTTLIRFHGGGVIGPGSTIGPILLLQDTNFVSFDDWFQFSSASVYVEGPPTNASGTGFSDTAIFDHVVFQAPGTAAIQNASVNWLVSNSNFALANGTACAPALQYVGGFTNQQNTTFINDTLLYSSASCASPTTAISVPAPTAGVGTLTMIGNLIVGPTAPANLNAFNIGNNQFIASHGNVENTINTLYTIGTGVTLDIGASEYSAITTFLSGTPAFGRIIDNTGKTTDYGTHAFAGTLALTNGLLFNTAPTISTHFNTSGDSILSNGTGSFTVTVGTGAGTSTGALSLPTAANGWNCWLQNQTRADLIQQSGSTTASATFTNLGTTFAATNWTNSDVLRGGCTAN